MTTFWGPMFPDAAGSSRYWGPHYPDGAVPIDLVAGFGPAGAATFALAIEDGLRVTYSWETSTFKSHSGRERRSGHRNAPKQTLDGSAYLLGADTRSIRSQLAQDASRGAAFLLTLPYEELTIADDASGGTVPVLSTAECDWAKPGQRVVIVSVDGETTIGGVVQAVTADTIELDVPPGPIGRAGGRIMPAMAIYLAGQQGFVRHRVTAEHWQISARAAVSGFAGTPAVVATLDLEAPVTNSGALDGVELFARGYGPDGDNIEVTQSDDALTSGGELVEDVDAQTLHIKYLGGVTTVAEYVALLASSAQVGIRGTYDPTAVLAAADDEFGPLNLSGGAIAIPGTMGVGATLTTYLNRPVFDRGLRNEGTVGDSMQSMAEIIDIGGVLASVGSATEPDWGRNVAIAGQLGPEFQWLKLFLFTIQGSRRAFWLPSWRPDMTFVSSIDVGNAAVQAALALEGLAMSGVLDGVVLRAIPIGAAGNGIAVTQSDDALTSGGELIEDVDAKTVHVKYLGGVSTVGELETLIGASALIAMTGSWNPADVLAASDDEFGPSALAGGIDAVAFGTVLTVDGGNIPVWYPLQRTNVQVLQTDGTVTYAAITSTVDNGDGTSDIYLDETLSAEDIELISWLDLCCLEKDAVGITFNAAAFAMQEQARTVQERAAGVVAEPTS